MMVTAQEVLAPAVSLHFLQNLKRIDGGESNVPKQIQVGNLILEEV